MFVDISEKKIVVIGGGTIATRRVNTLLSFAEHIVVVAPEITDDLQEKCEEGGLTWIKEAYCKEHLMDAQIVLALTDQPKVNHQVKADCQRLETETGRRILVNVADDKELCDFYFPSIVQHEEMVVGINAGGSSPALVKNIRKKIETLLNCKSIYEK